MFRKYFTDSLVDPDDQSENPVLRWIGVGRIDRMDDPAYFHGFRLHPLSMGMNLKQARGLRPFAPSFTPTHPADSNYSHDLLLDDTELCIYYFEPNEEFASVARAWFVANTLPISTFMNAKPTPNYQPRNEVRSFTVTRKDKINEAQ